MIKNKLTISIAVVVFMCIAFIAATIVQEEDLFTTHVVKKGETVSLLCIEKYGYYNKTLAEAFLRDNPSVKNINLIYVNQKLKFRKPIPPSKTVAASTDTVYQQKVDATQGVVTYVEGRAFIKKQGQSVFERLTVNSEVFPGDVIKTSKSARVELIINRESVVRLNENTELRIEAFRDLKKKEGKTALNFSLGSVWSKVKQFKDKISRFELELPTAIAGVHGTIYHTTVNSDSSAEVKVYDGEVQVSGKPRETTNGNPSKAKIAGKPFPVAGPRQVTMEEWTQIVRSMQSMKIAKNGQPSEPTDFQRTEGDDWEKWNEERDKRIAEMFSEK